MLNNDSKSNLGKYNEGERPSSDTFCSENDETGRRSETESKYNKKESPQINYDEAIETSTLHLGFKIEEDDLKKGITLDKLFGGDFKKINIFDAKRNNGNIDDVFHVTSNIENDTIRAEKYRYESFEIIETENEEDVESRQTQRKKNIKQQRESETEVTRSSIWSKNATNRNEEMYNGNKSKMLQSKRGKEIESEDIKNLTNGPSSIYNETEKVMRRNENRNSRSSSPNFDFEKNVVKVNKTKKKKSQFNSKEKQVSETTSVLTNRRDTTNYQKPFLEQKKNKFLTSSITFGNTAEKTGHSKERESIIQNGYKASRDSLNKIKTQAEDGLTEVSSSVLPSILSHGQNRGKNSLTPISQRIAKTENSTGFQHKLKRANHLTNEKIKLNDQQKLNHYSKVFKLNQQESKCSIS